MGISQLSESEFGQRRSTMLILMVYIYLIIRSTLAQCDVRCVFRVYMLGGNAADNIIVTRSGPGPRLVTKK